MTKVSITKLNAKKHVLFNNHEIKLNGRKIGVIGSKSIHSDNLVFISKDSNFDNIDMNSFSTIKDCKAFLNNYTQDNAL